jgi:methionyl-tRNA synthetase
VGDAWKVLSAANRYISAQEPWKLKKTDPARMATVLAVVLEVVRIVTLLVQPVMPESTARILDLLGVDEGARMFADIDTPVPAGTQLPAPSPVFPKHVEAAEESA